MSRSMQIYYISVTAFSSTDLFLDWIFLEWDSRGIKAIESNTGHICQTLYNSDETF